ncbi:MAG TPA: phosphatidate cytidylyltransferase [Candidatus Cybelea sp.]|nr:phosphatidate cytidylyltransferase [Candidatus Cybelea sp.]
MAAPAEPAQRRASSLELRLLSAAVLIPIAALAAWLGDWAWNGLVVIFGTEMILEWCRIVAHRRVGQEVAPFPSTRASVETVVTPVLVAGGLILFARYPQIGSGIAWSYLAICAVAAAIVAVPRYGKRALWFSLGPIYVAVPCAAIMMLRDEAHGLQQILWIVALVIAADTGAYAAGRTIGGPKLAPRISPNKTWAGLGGAVVSAALVGAVTGALLGPTGIWPLTAVSASLAVVEQAGDLAKSALKRHFGVKDAGNIIPGHGGAIDRVDGLIAVAVAVAGINHWIGMSVLTWL